MLKTKESMPNLVKKRKHKSWRERKACIVAKNLKEDEMKHKKNEEEIKVASSTDNSKHEGDLVLVDKIFEP